MAVSPSQPAILDIEVKISKIRSKEGVATEPRLFFCPKSIATQPVTKESTLPTKKAVANPRSPRKSTRKRFGEHSEAAFLERATYEGFGVAKPWGDSDRYDFILDSGHRLWRVQVKSTSHQIAGRYGYPFMAHSWEKDGSKRPYTPDQIDILAAYIVPEKLWYIIPIQALNGTLTFTLFCHQRPAGRGGAHRAHNFDQYREAWHLLRKEEEETEPV